MQSVTIHDLDKYFADLLKKVPEERRDMFEEIAEELLQAVCGRIGGVGKVQSWQDAYVGSGGGYAAVRPVADAYDAHGYAVGYVTNAINSGHKQTPGRFVPELFTTNSFGHYEATGARLKRKWVSGKNFYEKAQGDAGQIARAAMERFEARIQEAIQ